MNVTSPHLRKPLNGSGSLPREFSIKIRVARAGAVALQLSLHCIEILRVGLRAL